MKNSANELEGRKVFCNKRRNSLIEEIKKNKVLFLMILPSAMLLLLFAYIPMFGIVIAFKNYQYNLGILSSPWVGFKNFKYFFGSGLAFMLTRNTLLYNISFIIIGMFCRILFAILISEMIGKKIKRVLQSVMILPNFISWVIVGGFAFSMLNYDYGVINKFLLSFGFEKINVYNTPGIWKYIFVGIHIWKDTGFGTIFFLTTIAGINPELYEAAYLDGAGLIKRILYVTIPLIIPTAVILLLLSLGGILKGNFDMFYQLIGNNGQLFDATDVIDTYVFRSLITIKDFSLTAAAGLYQQAIGFVLVMAVNYVVKKIEPDNALF